MTFYSTIYFFQSLLVIFIICTSGYDIESELDDSVAFRFRWLTKDIIEDAPGYEKIDMLTADNEKYQCLIPIGDSDNKGNEKLYNGPNALQLLKPLFDLKICTTMIMSYWSYELCHGKSITQFHMDMSDFTKRSHEYSLGILTEQHIKNIALELSQKPDVESSEDMLLVNVDGVFLPYFEIEYLDGTPCDLTNNPRRTRVRYVCKNDGSHTIYTVKEVYTCEYEVVVPTFYLCRHPHYRPKETPQIDLDCVPVEENNKDQRPKRLQEIEKDSKRLQSYLFTLDNNLVKGTLVDKLRPEFVVEEFFSKINKEKVAVPRSPKVTDDGLILDQFLQGDYCLHGESGWWKYEFCYGKYVRQYREHSRTSKILVLLGNFDLDDHKNWVQMKKRKTKKIKSVSHFYSGGDYCDEIKAKRTVEVKLKCTETGSSWALTLVEPKVCSYVLNVESPLLCSLMDHIDEWSLFSRPSQGNSKEGGETVKGPPGGMNSPIHDEKFTVVDFGMDDVAKDGGDSEDYLVGKHPRYDSQGDIVWEYTKGDSEDDVTRENAKDDSVVDVSNGKRKGDPEDDSHSENPRGDTDDSTKPKIPSLDEL